jgi:murein L,D-transpeptidase YcbB/YkuD
MEVAMKTTQLMQRATAIAMVAVVAGCANWNGMSKESKGTTVGAGTGAVAGAVVGGPIGAVVGAGVGAYAGNQIADAQTPGKPATASSDRAYDPAFTRSVQQALNDKGFDAGPADGVWGASTRTALIRFQQANNLVADGEPGPQTLAALGVASRGNMAATTQPATRY